MSNFLTRTLSGIVFVALFLAGLLWHPIAYAVIFTFAVTVMMHEYIRITLGGSLKTAGVFSVITGAATFLLFFLTQGCGVDDKWLLVLPMAALCLPVMVLYTKEKDAYGKSPFLLAGLLYIAMPFALTNLIVFDPATGAFDGRVLLAVMIIIWTSDVGAYLFGMTLGQKFGKKLFPSISPKKSWAGYWGGLLLSLTAGWMISFFGLVDFPAIHSIILALIVNVTSTVGDLAESQLKRNFGVKDSGNIMPGHGGLLDRFDGALLAFPAAVLYIMLNNL